MCLGGCRRHSCFSDLFSANFSHDMIQDKIYVTLNLKTVTCLRRCIGRKFAGPLDGSKRRWHLPVNGRFKNERMRLAVIVEVPFVVCRIASNERQLYFLP